MPTHYEIHIAGHLDPQWSDWLEGMAINLQENGETELSGQLPDQSALYGVLNRLRDLNLKLLSVEKKEEV